MEKTTFKNKKNYLRQFKAVFKLLFSVFLTDPFGIILIFVFPIVTSVIWIILVDQGVLPQVPDVYVFNDPIKRWYEFSFFVVGLAGLFYIAIKFAQFRRTILFRRILIGGINKLLLSFLLLFFYFMISLFLLLIKVGLLFYYSAFRTEIKNVNLLAFIVGFLFFTITSVSVAFFIGSLPIKSRTTVSILSIFTLLVSLLLAGIILDIEIFLIDFAALEKDRWLVETYVDNWETIDFSSRIWRSITFLSPYQPSVSIVRNAHLDLDWKSSLDVLGEVIPFENLKFYRPMVYENIWQAIAMNSFWIIAFFGLGSYFLRRNN